MNVYLDLPYTSRVEDGYLFDSAKLMSVTGVNTGNLVFRHALSRMLDLSHYVVADYEALQELLASGNKPTRVLLSAANWIGSSPQYEADSKFRADILTRCDCPITIVGLGAQASIEKQPLELGPETRNFMAVLSERAGVIGVRDEYTADTFERQGLRNFMVVGCPSNFINLAPALGQSIKESAAAARSTGDWRDQRLHISEAAGGHALSGRLVQNVLAHLDEFGGFYVCQSPALLPMLFRESQQIPRLYVEAAKQIRMHEKALLALLRRSSLVFSCVTSWLDFARTCDLGVGMRIHGTIVALQAGVPAVLVAHDSRTDGLASAMCVPFVDPAEYLELHRKGPGALFEKVETSIERFDSTRRQLSRRFLQIFDESGLDLQPDFKAITAA